MIRMIGAVLLTVGSSVLGFGAVIHLEGRVRDLRGVIAGLEAMKRTLSGSLEPLSGMLAAAVQSTEGRPRNFYHFCQCEVARLQGRTFGSVWEAALESISLRLEDVDLSELKQLERVLGRFDADSQLAALERTIGQLDRQLEEAVDQRTRLGKVYGTMGISSGLFLAILLF